MKKIGLLIIIILFTVLICGITSASLAFGNIEVNFYLNGENYINMTSKNAKIALPIMENKEKSHFAGWFYDENYREKIEKESVNVNKLKNGKIFGKYEKCSLSNFIVDIEPQCGRDGSKFKECFICKNRFYEIIAMRDEHNFVGNRCNVCNFLTESKGFIFEEIEEGYEIIDFGECRDVDIIIPSFYQGKPVVSIGKSVFANFINLKTVKIPKTVKYIKDYAFNYCYNLYYVNFEDASQVIEIGNYAFEHCLNLKFLENPINLRKLGNNSFSYTKISSFAFGENLVYLGKEAFKGNSKLNKISFSKNNKIKILPYGIFSECSELREIKIPYNVEIINNFAFADCEKLAKVNISSDSKLNFIGENAFYSCKSLININIPKGVTELGAFAFGDCINLNDVRISEESLLHTIGEGAFLRNRSLNNFIFSSNLIKIGSLAFCEANLKNFTAPKDLLEIGDYAFMKNKELEYVDIFDSKVEVIEKWAFADCINLQTFYFSKKTYRIEESAFKNCKRITYFYLPDNFDYIGKEAFAGCIKLQKIRLADSLRVIEEGAFKGVDTSFIQLTDNIEYIGKGAFKDCKNLLINLLEIGKGWHEEWNIDSCRLEYRINE